MLLRLLADAVVVVHLAFIVFVVLGGLLVVRWHRLAWLHLPTALWGAAIELGGFVCPLTPLEVYLRRCAGETGYSGGFVEHYVIPIIYPGVLTRTLQVGLGVGVVTLNVAVYAWILKRRSEERSDATRS